jgi:hypothetical protein
LGRTWAKKGQTPLLRQACRYAHLSVISAVSAEGELHYHIEEESFTGESVVKFLKMLLEFFNQKLLIIWGGRPVMAQKSIPIK